MAKQTVAEKVVSAKDVLTALAAEGGFKALRQWSEAQGFGNRSAFPRFKAALLEIGLDYEALRSGTSAAKRAEVAAAITHEVTLFTDAKARCERFAVCDREGQVVWFGRFFDGEGSEQSAAELEAAKKAVWLAGKVREALGVPELRLNLMVDAEWLTWANARAEGDFKTGGKAKVLAQLAERAGLQLHVEWVRGTSNPADRWTTSSGYQKWQNYTTGLAALANKIGEVAPIDRPAPIAPVTKAPAPAPVIVEPPTTAPVATLPLTEEQSAQVAAITPEQLSEIAAQPSRRLKREWLYKHGLPCHAAAVEAVNARLGCEVAR
jgi:hypothetical protein